MAEFSLLNFQFMYRLNHYLTEFFSVEDSLEDVLLPPPASAILVGGWLWVGVEFVYILDINHYWWFRERGSLRRLFL